MGIFLGFFLLDDEVTGPGGEVVHREGSGFVLRGEDGPRAFIEGSFSLEAAPVREVATRGVVEPLDPLDQAAGRGLDLLGERD